VPPARKAGRHVQESVETRARVRESNKEGRNIVKPEAGNVPVPNYLRPCVGLDVHKGSITATRMDPGGQVVKTWTLPTTRPDIASLAEGIPHSVPIVLEASTAGKATASVLKGFGCELHMAAPNRIPKPAVKTDKRDSIRLAHLFQSGSMPECYVPPPEIEHLRLLTRNRRDLACKVTLVKNQVHSVVTRNLLDSELKGATDWFGASGLRKLVRLPFPPEERAHLARYLEQLELLAHQEDSMQSELAQVARDRSEIRLLMTIPGVGFYTAVGILAEIGEISRFPTKKHLASYAGLVPKADDSGDKKGQPHRQLKKGNLVLKSFLCTAVQGMLLANQQTAVGEFYRAKAISRPRQTALVAAARKLSAEVWKMLTFGVPYREEDADLTARKAKIMQNVAEHITPEVTEERMKGLADRLSVKAEALSRLEQEAGDRQLEIDDDT
jgi:transposase